MKEELYTQCRLRRGKTEQIAWIPSEFAKVGKFLKIKDEDGWRVIETGQLQKPASYFHRYGRDHLHQRKASDI